MDTILKQMNEKANRFYGERKILPLISTNSIQKSSTGKYMHIVHTDIKKEIVIWEYRYSQTEIDTIKYATRSD